MKFLILRASGWDSISDKDTDYKLKRVRSKAGFTPSVYPPIGLEYIASSIENAGHVAEIIDFTMEKLSEQDFTNLVNKSDAVGISVYTDEVKSVDSLAKKIKEIDKEKKIILGGPHCTLYPKLSFDDITYADIVVRGDGEFVTYDLIKHLEGRKKLSEIPGVYYKENGNIKNNLPLKIIEDLDSIPFPARHLVEKYEYGKMDNLTIFKPKFTSININRGCPGKCRFCSRYTNVIKDWGFRRRSAENVIEEFLEIDKKYKSVMIVDDIFMSDKKQAHNIMDGLIEHKTKVRIGIAGARVDSADKELYKKLKKANVKLISFGIESGNQDVLDYYKKRITLTQIKKAVILSRKMGFITIGSFILGAPFETKEHLFKTSNFANSLPLDVALFAPLHYYKGSEMWKEAVNEKKISPEEFMVPADSKRGLGNFRTDELFSIAKEISNRFYNRPSFYAKQIYRSLLRGDIKWLFNGLKLLNIDKNG